MIEQRIRTEAERFAAVLGSRPRARIVIEASTDSKWVAHCSRGPRPRGPRRRLELRAHVCDPLPQGQDRPSRCPGPGRGVPARRLPPRPSPLRSPSGTSEAGRGCRTPWCRRARATSRSSGPCSASTATAPSCVPSTSSSRAPTRRSNTSPSTIPACHGCARSPASARSPPPPSSPPSTTPGASPTRISSKATSASCLASAAPATRRPWPHHQGRPLACALAAHSSRGLDPAAPAARGPLDLGPAHRRTPRQARRRRGARPPLGRHSLCAPPGWNSIYAPPRGGGLSTPRRCASRVRTNARRMRMAVTGTDLGLTVTVTRQ